MNYQRANLIKAAQSDIGRLRMIRHDLHAHPELGFKEHRTAKIVAQQLRELGFKVTEGVGQTGVIGCLSKGTSTRSIGLRADMDALPMQEGNHFEHRSRVSGTFHGCGHDGHTTMLLGAARQLIDLHFDGTVVLIFQPAEEGLGGGRAMVEEGLFERFPVDAVFGLHNIPGLPEGHIGVKPGPMMASFDEFSVELRAAGGHAAFPHSTSDPLLAAAALVQSLQQIVSRNVDPAQSAVLSVTQLHCGTTHNVIAPIATLGGTVRAFDEGVRSLIESRFREIVQACARAHRVEATLDYVSKYPPTINDTEQAKIALNAAFETMGSERVLAEVKPLMAAEDFAFMLLVKPGAYAWIGNGVGSVGGCMVHNPGYDFNDAIIPYGVAYWTGLVRHILG
jgi:hippurate hydrolase